MLLFLLRSNFPPQTANTGDSLSHPAAIQAANEDRPYRLRTDSLDVSATNGKSQNHRLMSRASLNNVNGKSSSREPVPSTDKIRQRFRVSTPTLPMCPFMHPRQPEKSASSPMEERNPTQKHSPAPVFLHSSFRQVPSTEMSCSLTCRQKTDKKNGLDKMFFFTIVHNDRKDARFRQRKYQEGDKNPGEHLQEAVWHLIEDLDRDMLRENTASFPLRHHAVCEKGECMV